MLGRGLVAIVVASAALAGCGRDLRDVVVEHRAAVEAKLEAAKAARDAVRGAPPVVADAVAIAEAGPLLGRPLASTRADTAVAYLEDLAAPAELGHVPHRIEQTGLLNRCAAALTTHREPYDPRAPVAAPPSVTALVAADLFERCEGLRWLVVVRTAAYAAPGDAATTTECGPPKEDALDAGVGDGGARDAAATDAGAKAAAARDAGAVPAAANVADAGLLGTYAGALGVPAPSAPTTCLRYDGGFLRAEAFVFDLEHGGAPLGGFAFEAESSRRLDVAEDRGGSRRVLDADLTAEIALAFRRAARGAMNARFVEDSP